MNHRISLRFAIASSLALAPIASAQLSPSEKEDIGFTQLVAELGAATPTGDGLSVSQIEAFEGANYRPNTALFPSKSFAFPSGGSTGSAGHANTVGQYFYGVNSLAPDIGAAADSAVISSWQADNWITGGFLNAGNPLLLPNPESNSIQNHSYVGTTGITAQDEDILRRSDFAISRDDYLAVFGVNNGSTNPLPNLMGQSYNGIAVGLSNGNHSSGFTSVDGSGRVKPEIVVPTSATSWATPTVAAAGAMIIDTALSTPGLGNAARHEVTKALLLNGATKNESEFGGTWSNSPTIPIDTVYGVGELNIRNSHRNLTVGEVDASPSTTVTPEGWDLGDVTAATAQLYFFDLPAGSDAFTLTATLVWDRQVIATDTEDGPGVNFVFTSLLDNLDLQLLNASGFTPGSVVEQSISTNNNLEHLYVKDLAAGRYVFSVSSDSATAVEYGLAWRFEQVPEPSTAMLSLLGAALVFRRKR